MIPIMIMIIIKAKDPQEKCIKRSGIFTFRLTHILQNEKI